jgi:hypothetical protein
MNPEPIVTDLATIQRHAGFQSLQPVERPSWWGVDRDMSRRPGVPMLRTPQAWPNSIFPPQQQPGVPAAPLHGRTNKPMPPVFGTSTPLHGLSGAVRRLAYRYPDHKPRHWLLALLGDRVDSWTHRARKYGPMVVPAAAAFLYFRGRHAAAER